jgi:A/G-specific adenine glycosylase
MLQQTQVATVIPYYERFLIRFPDVQSLAAANLDEVYQLWAGLGYYRRARQLHAAARSVVESGQCPFPLDRDAIAQLPGIGRYTANAVASFAYDQRCGIVEANTQRLYARLLRCKTPLSASSSQKQLWDFAEAIAIAWPLATGQLNQALMEIGSQVCKPKSPACDQCPLQKHCLAYRHSETDTIPAPKLKKQITELQEVGLLVHDSKGRWLLRLALDFAAEAFLKLYSKRPAIAHECVSVKHSVTRYRILLRCYLAQIDGKLTPTNNRSARANPDKNNALEPSPEQLAWYTSQELDQLALSSSARKVADWLKTHKP